MDTHYKEKNLTCTVTNLFSAGTDTTASSLGWGLLLMAKYPQIQGKERFIVVTGRATLSLVAILLKYSGINHNFLINLVSMLVGHTRSAILRMLHSILTLVR